MSTVYIEKVEAESLQLTNSTGADLVQFQFTVMAGKSLVADEAIAAGAVGGLTNANGMVLQIADYVTSEGTFATVNAPVYWNPADGKFSDTLTVGYHLVGYVKEIKSGTVTKFVAIDPIVQVSGRAFVKTVTLTAAAAATPVTIVPASDVGVSEKIYITDLLVNVGGATAWTDSTGTVVKIQDTADTPVVAASVAKAQLTNAAILGKHSTGVTLATPIITGVGLTADKGLVVLADSDFDAGSNLYVTVMGTIK